MTRTILPFVLALALVAAAAVAAAAQPLSPESGVTLQGWVTILQDNFEETFPGPWDAGDGLPGFGNYSWGKRDCQAHQGQHSAWAVGGGQDGAALGCGSTYPASVYSYMTYGPFSLEDASAAELTFHLWLRTEPYVDEFYYQYSTNGHYFWGADSLTGDSDGWIPVKLDLAEVVGEPKVWIAFIFSTDEDVQYGEGCYVDDVLLKKLLGSETQTPTATCSATPSATVTARATGTATGTLAATTTASVTLAASATSTPTPTATSLPTTATPTRTRAAPTPHLLHLPLVLRHATP